MSSVVEFEEYSQTPAFGDLEVATLKLPPHSLEAEQSVIGGLLIRGDAFDDVSDVLVAGDFFQPKHRKIFEAIGRVHGSGEGIDPITVAEALPDVEQVGGIAYLMELTASTPSTANIRAYAKLVNERAQERDLIAAAQSIVDDGFNSEIKLAEKIATAQQRILAVGETSAEAQLYGDDALRGWLEDFTEECENGISFGLSTGFGALDKLLRGFQPSDLVLLGARPGMGKSTLAFQIAAHVALEGNPTMIFSLEMSRRQIYNKVIAGLGRIPLTHVADRKMSDEDWPKFSAAFQKIKGRPFYVDERGGLHVNQIMATARRMHRKNPLKLVIVDYLQLVRGDGDNRTGEVGSVSRNLKALAKELNCTVLALTQLNREVEKRPNKRPKNSDLRDSGELEQDADTILFVYRDEVYNDESDQEGIAEIICSKFRNGEPDKIGLASQLHCSRFDSLAYEYRGPSEPDQKSKSTGLDY